MNYSGPLFGKVGGQYIPLRMSAEDVDKMLEALEAIVAFDTPLPCGLLVQARSAIAKAKGETP